MGTVIQNIVPKDVFQDIVEGLKEEVTVTSITQSGSETTLTCDASTMFSGNYVLIDCGDLQGYYRVKKWYSTKIVIRYSGAYTVGTIKTQPYYDWGTIKEGHISVNENSEFPMIFFILPTPYSVNTKKNETEFISGEFKFLIIDTFKAPKAQEKNKTDYIFGEVVSRMSALALRFQQAMQDHKVGFNKLIMKDPTFRRSEEIPFGVTFSGDNGADETFVQMSAGCYFEASVRINKIYNC